MCVHRTLSAQPPHENECASLHNPLPAPHAATRHPLASSFPSATQEAREQQAPWALRDQQVSPEAREQPALPASRACVVRATPTETKAQPVSPPSSESRQAPEPPVYQVSRAL